MQLIHRCLELRILGDPLLIFLHVIGFLGDGVVPAGGVPVCLNFRRHGELDELPGAVLFRGGAILHNVDGRATDDRAGFLERGFIGTRQETGAQFELALCGIEARAQASGGFDHHRGLLRVERFLGVGGRATKVAKHARVVPFFPPLQNLDAFRRVERGFGRTRIATVAIVEIQAA